MERIVFLLFLCPGLPKDALTYIVAFNKTIPPLPLFFLTTIARFPAMALTVKMGSSLWEGNWKMTALVVGILILIAAAGGLIRWHHKKKHGKSLWRLKHLQTGRRKNRAACFYAVFWMMLAVFSLFNRSCAALALDSLASQTETWKTSLTAQTFPKQADERIVLPVFCAVFWLILVDFWHLNRNCAALALDSLVSQTETWKTSLMAQTFPKQAGERIVLPVFVQFSDWFLLIFRFSTEFCRINRKSQSKSFAIIQVLSKSIKNQSPFSQLLWNYGKIIVQSA